MPPCARVPTHMHACTPHKYTLVCVHACSHVPLACACLNMCTDPHPCTWAHTFAWVPTTTCRLPRPRTHILTPLSTHAHSCGARTCTQPGCAARALPLDHTRTLLPENTTPPLLNMERGRGSHPKEDPGDRKQDISVTGLIRHFRLHP